MKISEALPNLSSQRTIYSPSKPSTATKSRVKMLKSPETPFDFKDFRTSLTPNRTNSKSLTKELLRIEEELDFVEISLNNQQLKDFTQEKEREKGLKLYETYIEEVIHSLGRINHRIYRSLNRAWVAYRKFLIKPTQKPTIEVKSEATNTIKDCKDFSVQADDKTEVLKPEENCEEYITIFNTAIARLDNMNHTKLILTLRQLLSSLKQVEIPNLTPGAILGRPVRPLSSKSPMKDIKEHFSDPLVIVTKSKYGKILITREIQTGLTSNDVSSWDYLKIMLKEKEKKIIELTELIKPYEELQANFNLKSKELEEQKTLMKDLLSQGCKQCKEKLRKLAADKEEIKELKQTVSKTEGIETELAKTKSKLKESIVIINKKNEKIEDLNNNIDELVKMIESIKSKRLTLEEELKQEEQLKHLVETKLQNTITHNNSSFKAITKKFQKIRAPQKKDTNEPVEVSAKIPTKSDPELESQAQIIKKRTFLERTLERKITDRDNSGFKSKPIESETFSNEINKESDDSISAFGEKRLTEKNLILTDSIVDSVKVIRKSKMDDIMKTLNLTKEEYSALSKKARIELYECLFDHKERCGTDCEHLKRAMMIRYKDKGLLYPTKIYNIVKK